ncbi:TonB-dependent receptor [Granulicella sp. S156]|uniref:TonB-dependent receptor n=1 Tax=Granulicella sp. S156 TaxID=1747224 RepID=UPI001C206623|nr:TonB-dependent receptor [Granulicella sp. S156]
MGLLSVPGFAQGTSASVTGVIIDPSGALLPGVTVTAQNTDTTLKQTAVSSASGLYSIAPLPPGHYRFTAVSGGFETYNQLTTLTVGQAVTLNFTLQVGHASQSVTVDTGEILLNTTNAEISNVVDQASITQLPLNGRDPASLIFLSPGVTNVLNTSAGTLPTSAAFPNEVGGSGNGGEQGSTYALLDGVPNMDFYDLLMAPFPNPDATHAFRAVTNNYSVQYGFSPSAIINIETNPGSNSIHAGVFEFIRNGALNASNWFSGAVDGLKQNQFGGYIGAPIIKDKLFVFVNYQGTRKSLASATETSNTPTAAMLNGDFSALPFTLKGPFTTVNGVKNQINPALFSKAAVDIAEQALPLGQDPSTGLVTFSGPTVDSSLNEGTARLDYIMSDKMRFFARSFITNFNDPAVNVNGNILATAVANSGRFYNEEISNTWLPSATLVNTVSAAWISLNVGDGSQVFTKAGNPFCLSEYINVADPPGCFTMNLDANFSGPNAQPNATARTTWWISDDAIKTLGKHTLQFGGAFAHQYENNQTDYPAQPIISFNGYYTGYANADFLLGQVGSFTQGAFQNSPTRGVQFALYLQDQYHASKKLTVTAGLRWEPDWAATSINGGAGFVPGQQSVRYPNAPAGLIFPGDKGLNSTLRHSSNTYFEPRVSAAYQATPSTVIRGGVGIFVSPLSWAFYNHVIGVAPIAPLYSFSATAANPISFQNPWASFAPTGGTSPFPSFATNPNVPANQAIFLTPMAIGSVFSPNFRLGVTQTWNASIEQQVTNAVALHFAYVGSQNYHQATIVDQNPGIYANASNRTTYSNFSYINQVNDEGTTSYQSMQLGVTTQVFHGLKVDSHFTWSKTLSLSDSGNTAWHGGLGDPFSDPADKRWNRGISSVNIPLISVTDFIYTTPSLRGHNTLVKSVAGSWEVSGIWSAQSGLPFSVEGGNGGDSSGSLQYSDRADIVPGQPFRVHQGPKSQWIKQYMNTAAFAPNNPGTFGDSGKNILQAPGTNSWDMALMKNFKVSNDRYNVQFRWEMFNAFNHPNFGQPDNTVTDPNFGQITSIGAVAPRVMQGALKLSF